VSLALIASLSVVFLVLLLLAFSEIGRRVGIAGLARSTDGLPKGTGAAETALFGLLGLLLAFTFSGAASRFENRRHLSPRKPTRSAPPTSGSICFRPTHGRS